MTLSHVMRGQGAEDDVEMADAPDDFLDPITYTVMQDPVKLPSGAVMDRPNVLRMLLSDPRDPTTRYTLVLAPNSCMHCILALSFGVDSCA